MEKKKMSSVFRQALEEAQKVFKKSIFADISTEDFEWETLAKIITEDDAPIRQVFSEDTIRLAYLLERSVDLEIAADNANLSETIEDGDTDEEESKS